MMVSLRFLLITLFSILQLASSYVLSNYELEPRASSGIDPVLFNRFQKYAHYAGAAYNSANTAALSKERKLNAVGLQANVMWTIKGTPISDTEAFVSVSSTEIVLSIRGSVSMSNWFADVNFKHEPVKFCSGCQVHGGFATAWEEIKLSVTPVLKKLAKQYPKHSIIVVGHSLGGAIATLAGFDLRGDSQLGRRIEMFSYASPKVGDPKLAAWMSQQVASGFHAYRIVAVHDPVPHLPLNIMGFAHFQPNYYIQANADHPRPTDIVLKNKDTFEFDISIQAHLDYFSKNIGGSSKAGLLATLLKGQFPTWQTAFKRLRITRRALVKRMHTLLQDDIGSFYRLSGAHS